MFEISVSSMEMLRDRLTGMDREAAELYRHYCMGFRSKETVLKMVHKLYTFGILSQHSAPDVYQSAILFVFAVSEEMDSRDAAFDEIIRIIDCKANNRKPYSFW